MKTLITTILLWTAMSPIFAQDIYTQKMAEALTIYAQVENLEAYKSAAVKFEQIAQVETEKWQPRYYQAQAYIMMSFTDSKAKAETRDAYLNEADQVILEMINIAPAESEVFALQALYYTAKLVIDPMNRGQKFGALTQVAIQKSLAMDSENPRAQYLNLSNKIGTAQFFNQDTSPFCADAETLLNNWDNYQKKGPFYPIWGKELVAGIVENCSVQPKIETEVTPTTTAASTGNKLTITVENLKSNSGLVMLELVDENEQTVSQAIGIIENNKSTMVIENITTGLYAIRYFHDDNENKKMDTNKHGIPQETYGFSNNKRGFMGAPKFKKTTFQVESDLALTLKAK